MMKKRDIARIMGIPAAAVALLSLVILTAAPVDAQRGRGPWNTPPKFPTSINIPADEFIFCTIMYQQGRTEDLGFGWGTDYPDSGENFMTRLEELTTIRISRDEFGVPNQVVLRLTDDELYNYPFIFMSDVGTVVLDHSEIECLRNYLLRGGFLLADDFWGEAAWSNWEAVMSEVFPPDEYPIRDIPLSHEIFNIVFHVKEVPQVPSIQHWVRSNGATTSERGWATAEPHFRGIWDKNGRLMVAMTHNTDIADGWEKEGESEEYFREFSVKKAYPLGINIVVYALTH